MTPEEAAYEEKLRRQQDRGKFWGAIAFVVLSFLTLGLAVVARGCEYEFWYHALGHDK